jgi:pimeloyl-ACP methyl ester carboxylesterase
VNVLPGYGLPAAAGDDLHPRALAERVLVDVAAEARDVLLLAHSASCQVAAHVADLAPDGIAGLVLVGPTTDPRAATWRRLAARWLATAGHETPRQVPSLVRQYRSTTLRTMVRAMEVARSDTVTEVLARATTPALVLRGRHDRISPQDWGTHVASRAAPGSRLFTLPAGGHMVPLTHGPLVADAVSAFLAERG